MRFMMMVKATEESEAGVFPGQEFMAEMGKFTEELMKAGVVLMTDGLQPSSKGTRIKYSGGKRTVIDGPFTETKELIAGYALVQVNSKEEAMEVANRFVELHMKAGINGEVEIRPLFDPAEFCRAKP
jgi:hypothetical protein